MLMLAPGYTMPAAAVAEGEAAVAGAEEGEGEPAVDLEGELPGGDASQAPVVVQVRQGRNRYRVRVRRGLATVTFGELSDYLAEQMLPPGIPSSELRLIARGKTASREDPLCPEGSSKDMSVMLMFREGFFVAAEGAKWLQEKSTELGEAEVKLVRLTKRVEANFSNAETSVQLAELEGLLESLVQSVDSVRVNATKLPQMRELRDRSANALERVLALHKTARF
ncbi:unnamed protein product [Polarella glacialis]|uniref:Uncharacterized protein n=1 Tax=Polarella glacialis TaxID=89957 RepID=A0A813GBS9_POLGL|nr:unnamed protein product [Polarella glacialis]